MKYTCYAWLLSFLPIMLTCMLVVDVSPLEISQSHLLLPSSSNLSLSIILLKINCLWCADLVHYVLFLLKSL
uniref:Uncharacterized protein n=1 Tax=Rhizophora mucronata TaxID=61149 RepID=A0A2P2IXD8_RHIMU